MKVKVSPAAETGLPKLSCMVAVTWTVVRVEAEAIAGVAETRTPAAAPGFTTICVELVVSRKPFTETTGVSVTVSATVSAKLKVATPLTTGADPVRRPSGAVTPGGRA